MNQLRIFKAADSKARVGWCCAWFCLMTLLSVGRSATLQTLYYFSAGPTYPYAGLVQGDDGSFYGTSLAGGKHGNNSGGYGTVFRITTNSTLTIVASFANTNGANPRANLIRGRDGSFYGTTENGGSSAYGTVFKITTNGVLTSLCSFPGGNEGKYPQAALAQGDDSNFYGTTSQGGPFSDQYSSYGTVFRVTTNGTLTTLVTFAGTNGANPQAGLVKSANGNFFGSTVNGGDYGFGTLFMVTTNGALTTLVSFASTNGANPRANLIEASDGNFYGTTYKGGPTADVNGNYSYGTVFKVTTNGTLTTLAIFDGANGNNPCELIAGIDGNFYGTTVTGGSYSNIQYYINPWMDGYGTVFKLTTNGTLTTLYSFGDSTHVAGTPFDGGNPSGRLVQGADGNLYGTAYNGGSADFGTVFKITTDGTLTTLAALALNPNGANPYGGLIQASDGDFYGTTSIGGTNGYHQSWVSVTYGTVFKVSSNGDLTTLVSFDYTNGANPSGRLFEGSDRSFYGTAKSGGTNGGYGTVFRVTTNGVLTSLFSFGNSNGASPSAGLLEGNGGRLYGTTSGGGTNSPSYGTVFEVTTNGDLTTLVSFAHTNGSNPCGDLVQGSDGSFYGTAASGGSNAVGAVFKVTTNGVLTTLAAFPAFEDSSGAGGMYPDGASPQSGFVLGSDGDFYSTTVSGGTSNHFYHYGTVFKVTTNGTLTKLVSLGGWNGVNPYGGLTRGPDDKFYGTTYRGGTPNFGTVFQVTTNGTYTNLISFNNSNGAYPYAGLLQGSDVNLYGTTLRGGLGADSYNDGYGTVFRAILPPFIFVQPTNQTVLPGASATFVVGASGFDPLSYQWRRNGANIAGATNSSLLLTSVRVTNAATYTVLISNPGGSVISSNATLTVACPTITINPTALPLATFGKPYSHTNSATGGTAPYTFARTSGFLPPGFTLSSNGVLSGTLTNTSTYSFTVRATDIYGCTSSQSYTLALGVELRNSTVDSNGWFRANIVGPSSSTYVMLASTNVAQPLSDWIPLVTNSAPNGVFNFTDTNSIDLTNWPQRFYRVRRSP